ncbi:uncharacterized protein LOC115882865 [Sitophilus oryzae]|uniref:Uncharacterized protein LOC115882865 n=1 Tax=Sitophilus oryzae TaxID=7048 RepID=A0A6J2XZQ6_SITOR|nr:uncharacterized protein LOC115882865 [Sitophilus oryzae]XP_030756984.1 uncharacterized protein LOC115882865 [Sitophilus oryzae]XP_030756993.1 uncharacterized protein LOC115882865 [Sitophilus oryzae]
MNESRISLLSNVTDQNHDRQRSINETEEYTTENVTITFNENRLWQTENEAEENRDVTNGVDANDGHEGEIIEIPLEPSEESNGQSDGNLFEKEPRKMMLFGFAGKKTIAQGMMDIALITANANQLRYVLEFSKKSFTYRLSITLISLSLLLQVAVGLFLIYKGRFDVKGESKSVNAKKVNNYVFMCVFLITILNVFIASFTVMENDNGLIKPSTP